MREEHGIIAHSHTAHIIQFMPLSLFVSTQNSIVCCVCVVLSSSNIYQCYVWHQTMVINCKMWPNLSISVNFGYDEAWLFSSRLTHFVHEKMGKIHFNEAMCKYNRELVHYISRLYVCGSWNKRQHVIIKIAYVTMVCGEADTCDQNAIPDIRFLTSYNRSVLSHAHPDYLWNFYYRN